jgi:integrase
MKKAVSQTKQPPPAPKEATPVAPSQPVQVVEVPTSQEATAKKFAEMAHHYQDEKLSGVPAQLIIPTPVHRSELLKGVKVEQWLRAQVDGHKKDNLTNLKTKEDYRKISNVLELTRSDPWEPVQIEKKAGTKNTFYKYRAATRFVALERAELSLKAYEKALKSKNDVEKKAAYAIMLTAAADLIRYPADAKPGFDNPTQEVKAEIAWSLAIGDTDIANGLKKQKSEFKKGEAKETNAKLKDAQKIQKIEGWRTLIFNELVKRKGSWIQHAAVAALTGCRPAEVTSVQIEKVGKALVITIPGAKVSESKGQPYRKFTITSDKNGPEFAYLFERVKEDAPLVLEVPLGIKYPAATFSEVLKSAGEKVFPKNTPPMTGYIYRHAIACDMKADGADMNHIAASMGHAVTKTQNFYGRASGGKAGTRVFSIEATREIKQTHGTNRYTTQAPTIEQSSTHVAFQSPTFESWGL